MNQIEDEFEDFLYKIRYKEINDLNNFRKEFNNDFLNIENFAEYLLKEIVLNENKDIFYFFINKYKFDTNFLYPNNRTILQFVSACNSFDYEIAMTLLNYQKPDINIVDKWGNNPIWTALYVRNAFKNTNNQEIYDQWIHQLYISGFRPNKITKKVILQSNDTTLKNMFHI